MCAAPQMSWVQIGYAIVPPHGTVAAQLIILAMHNVLVANPGDAIHIPHRRQHFAVHGLMQSHAMCLPDSPVFNQRVPNVLYSLQPNAWPMHDPGTDHT